MKRVALQFTPYSWTDFNWKPTSSLIRWFATLGIFVIFLLAELNTFYLKFVLWIPPEHYLNLGRLVFILFMGAAALRETFQYLDDPEPNKFGRQSWMMIAIVITELLVTVKFDYETITKPLPKTIAYFWILGFLGLVGYTVWKFYIKRDVKNDVALKPKTRVKEDTISETEPYIVRTSNINNNGVQKRTNTRNGSAEN
ncbi:phosphatidylserine synthase 2-like [Ruditapes philippinarum]|nr:phosphatidylserine synthase 2-like [Ruditapes philippinarum]